MPLTPRSLLPFKAPDQGLHLLPPPPHALLGEEAPQVAVGEEEVHVGVDRGRHDRVQEVGGAGLALEVGGHPGKEAGEEVGEEAVGEALAVGDSVVG